jgi:hypothetical protein
MMAAINAIKTEVESLKKQTTELQQAAGGPFNCREQSRRGQGKELRKELHQRLELQRQKWNKNWALHNLNQMKAIKKAFPEI